MTTDDKAKHWIRLFVYGLLMRKTGSSLSKHFQQCGGVYVEEGVVPGYTLYGTGVAFAWPKEGGRVEGEVWMLPNTALPEFDRIEAGYRRRLVYLCNDTMAWMYVAKHNPTHYMEREIGSDYMAEVRGWMPMRTPVMERMEDGA